MRALGAEIDYRDKTYSLDEAVKIVKANAKAKFDETIEVAMNLGIDPRHADQAVRGMIELPNGTGKSVRVAVFARGPTAEEAKAAGADVIGQNVDSPAAGQFAESAGIPWVGYDSNASKFAPKQWLTAAVYNWGPYYASRVQAVMDGTWKTGFYYGNIKDGMIDIAPFGPSVSAKTKAAIAAKKKALNAGTWNEFQGPITDQAGKVRIAAGKRPSVADLYAMDYLVKGIEGSPKG